MRRDKATGELELAVMKAVCCLARASVRDVLERLGSGYAYTTVMTVMQRLFQKGSLKREKEGRQFIYSAAKGPKYMGKKPAELICYLLESGTEMSSRDLDEIERLIEERRS